MNSIEELIKDIKGRAKDGILLRYADDAGLHSVTNEKFLSDVERYVRSLYRHFGDDTKGRHIAMVAPVGYEYVVGIFACELAGAVIVLLNPLEEESRIKDMLAKADVDLVIKEPGIFLNSSEDIDESGTEFDSLIKGAADDFAFLLFTSGTEGNMKGVMLSQRNVLASAGDVTGVFGGIASIRSDITFNSCYIMLPLHHVFGLSILFTAISGRVIVDMCIDFRQFFRDLQLMNSEIVACPPSAIKMFVNDLRRGNRSRWGKGLKFIFSGAATIPEDEQRLIAENNLFVALGYGMTELAGPATINCFMDKFASVGKAAPRTVIEIRDREIFIKNDSVMLGYYKDPEASEAVLRDGWIATGDYGYLDEEGFLFITGRKKNLIILSSGENVSPEELEKRLYENQSIKECRVYGERDKIVAEVYAPEATEAKISEFVDELNSRLPGYKRIYHVIFRDSELAKTASGKIKR